MTTKRPTTTSLAKIPNIPKTTKPTMWCADGTCLSMEDIVRRVNRPPLSGPAGKDGKDGKDSPFANNNFNIDDNNAFRFRGNDFALGYGNKERGDSGPSRALVKDIGNVLKINYNNDFSGGTVIDGNVQINGTLNGISLDRLMYRLQQLENHSAGNNICKNKNPDDPEGCLEMKSPSGRFIAFFDRGQGIFRVIDRENNRLAWASPPPPDTGKGPFRLVMQTDGNLVVYDRNNMPTWASGTDGRGYRPYYLSLNDSGELTIIDSGNNKIWKA